MVYLLAFTSIDNFNKGKSATPLITKGNCSINVMGQDDFASYTFTFLPTGTVLAQKDGIKISGQWMEDNISKKINIHFSTYNPTLTKLNNSWKIKDVTENQLLIESQQANNPSLLTIASL